MRCKRRFPHDERGFRGCYGMLEDRSPFRTQEWESRLRRDDDPILAPMHGGVSAQRMAALSVELSRLCPTPPVEAPELWPNGTVVVEFGCGNAALLSIVAPRAPHIFGVGTEVAGALVEHAAAYFPHLAVHRAIGAPMVPSGAAVCGYSVAVVMYLSASATCNHVAEGLRVLQPGGRMVLHGVPLRRPKQGSWSTFSRTFFMRERSGGRIPQYLPACSNGIGRLVRNVTLPTANFAVYPSCPQFMTVVIERNDAPFPCTLQNAWPNADNVRGG